MFCGVLILYLPVTPLQAWGHGGVDAGGHVAGAVPDAESKGPVSRERFVRGLRRDGGALPGRLSRPGLGARVSYCIDLASARRPRRSAADEHAGAPAWRRRFCRGSRRTRSTRWSSARPTICTARRPWRPSRRASTCCCRSRWRGQAGRCGGHRRPRRRDPRARSGLYMSYFDQPLIHDLRDMVAQGWLGDIVHCYARLMHKGGMMWSRRSAGGQPQLARRAGGDRRRLFHSTGGALRPHLRMGHRRASGARHGLHAQSALSRTRRRGSGGRRLRTGYRRDGHDGYGVVHQWRGTLGSRHRAGGSPIATTKLALCSNAGPFRGRVARVLGRPDAAFGGTAGEEQQMEISRRRSGTYANPLNQHRAVPGSGARWEARAGADAAACAICAWWRRCTNRRAPGARWRCA